MNDPIDPRRARPVLVKRGSVTVKIYRGATHGYESFTLCYHEGGQRVRRTFPSLARAKTEAEIVATRLDNGDRLALELTGTDRQQYLTATSELRELGIPLHLAIKEFVAAKKIAGENSLLESARFHRAHTDPVRVQRTVEAAVDECLEAKAGDGLSVRYLTQLRSDLKRFARDFNRSVADVTGAEIDDWLRGLRHDGAPVSGRTRNNLRTSIVTLLSFAKRRGYLPRELPTEAQSVPKSKVAENDVKIMTPDEMRRILDAARGDLLAHLVIAGFAGLRTAEIERLRWDDIDPVGGHITISAANAKTASRRLTPITENLRAWLAPLRDNGVTLGKKEIYKDVTALAREVGVEWSQNVLRHSAISYRLALVPDMARVALEAGTSPGVIFKHYRQLATPTRAQAWFDLKP